MALFSCLGSGGVIDLGKLVGQSWTCPAQFRKMPSGASASADIVHVRLPDWLITRLCGLLLVILEFTFIIKLDKFHAE
uniref:Uncharacterized protein n=1 Tax=Anguilla anguilla TaxID=7936 RepID=A0A0E9U7Q7_ANGAN